jgi:hypothetical protein
VAALMGGVALLHLGVNALTAEDESWQELRQRAVRSLREGAPLIIVYGTALPEWIGHYRAQAEEFAERYQSWGRPASVVSDRDLTATDRRQALILLGRPEANRWVREVEGDAPVRFSPHGFSFGGREYEKPQHVLRLVTLSPWNGERPIVLIAGASHQSLLARRGFWFGGRDYSILEGRRTIRYGRFREGGIDPTSDVDIESEQEAWTKSLRHLSSQHLELFYPEDGLAESKAESIARLLEDRLATAAREVGVPPELSIRFYLYPSHETKGRLVDSVASSHVDSGAMTVHVIYSEERRGLDGAEEVGLLLDRVWGAPVEPYLRAGYARVLAGLPSEGEAARFVYLGFAAELRRLAATDSRASLALPEPVYRALAASWVSFLRERMGVEAFRRYYTGAEEHLVEQWEGEWRRRLELDVNRRAKGFAAEAERSRAAYSKEQVIGFFHKGLNYAYTNNRDNGYPTTRSRESLEDLRDMTANAVALVPYGFSSPDRKTGIRRAGDSISTESDESLRVAKADARRLGLRVMLKPQIWLSYQDWPSGIDFETDEEWDAWFESYESWILSYALLAEELRVDLFCVGTELTHPALERPERFRELISRVRRIYHGPLTYAANWYEEFEKVSFWDAVDLIGLDNYFPLAESPETGEEQLRAAAIEVADRVETVARRAGKAVIFTEVGFPSVRADRSKPDLERQALLYRITFETYWPRPWFYGLYWWKWFSDPANAGPGGDAWTPRGKPAEGVVADWFAKPSPRAHPH